MNKPTILFADNDPDFLKTRTDFLEQEGYQVVPATDPTEARRLLERGGVDLAILDIRLRDDDDDKDTSGLTLAKEVARTIPKVILTNFPSVDAVREALKPQLSGLSPAVDFVGKQEGPEVMIASVKRSIAVHVKKQPRQVVFNLSEQLAGTLQSFVGGQQPNHYIWVQVLYQTQYMAFEQSKQALLIHIRTLPI
jgi:DNA-binding NtrC family response regulator